MGKPVTVQKRGKGSTAYRAPSFRFKGRAAHPPVQDETVTGTVAHITTCQAHTAPLAYVQYDNGAMSIMLAPEGMYIGQEIQTGSEAPVESGSTLPLEMVPEGTLVYNIEARPGDGGKFVRASGGFARVEGKSPKGVIIKMPSKKQKIFNAKCRVTVGILAGGGRTEKPLLKAGNMHYKQKARNHLYPSVSASAMNAVDHPYGNKRTARKSKARPVSRHAPPGRKVGMIAARRTGRRKK